MAYIINDECINCGSCGAPNCMALAEDIVRGLKVSCKYKEAEKK